MTFWLMAAKEGETPESIKQRSWISKPELDLHDYSKMHLRGHVREQVKAGDEDMPLETVAIKVQRLWKFVHEIEVEDIICMVWKKNGKPAGVCFAEVTGSVYAEPMNEAFEHRVPVQWFQEQAGTLRLRPFLFELGKADEWPSEIKNAKFRLSLRNHLPLPGNKFVKWKWLIFSLIFIKLCLILMRSWQRAEF